MKLDIFEHAEYKEYLKNWCRSRPKRGWGTRSILARAAGCQVAYVSQVLNGPLHFSLEQSQELNKILGHGSEEIQYFLLLVQKARAGTHTLKKHFEDQLREMKQKRFVLMHQLGIRPQLEKEHQMIYYSSWIFAAVHVLADIPQFQTKEAMSRRLGLSIARVADTLTFLISAGLVSQDGNIFKMSQKSIHLGTDSPLLGKHHSNWRMRAIDSLDKTPEDSLHYSSAITLSHSDYEKVRSRLIETIKEIKATIRDSKQEEIYCFNLDLFGI